MMILLPNCRQTEHFQLPECEEIHRHVKFGSSQMWSQGFGTTPLLAPHACPIRELTRLGRRDERVTMPSLYRFEPVVQAPLSVLLGPHPGLLSASGLVTQAGSA